MMLSIKTFLRRLLNRRLNFNHPVSYPFLTMDGFRAFADFVYDQFSDFDPKSVKNGDVIFVRGGLLDEYFQKMHSRIESRYILLSGNEDFNVESRLSGYLDDKIIHWFAQNLLFYHEKASILPIGIYNHNDFSKLIENQRFLQIYRESRLIKDKKSRIAYSFGFSEGERKTAEEKLKKSPISEKLFLPQEKYYQELANFQFIASPSGNGIDCHRTWEAMYFRVIPIMLSNNFSNQLKDCGFPVFYLKPGVI